MDSTIEELEEALGSMEPGAERAELLNRLGGRIAEADPRRAMMLAEEARALAVAFDAAGAHARSLLVTAICHDSLSDYPAAEEYSRRALEIYREHGDRLGMANALNSIGITARGMSNFPVALETFREALAIFTEMDDRSRMAAAHNNIGVVHSSIGNLSESLDAYLAALRIYEEAGDEATTAITTSNIAIIQYYLGDRDRSYDFHSRSLEVFQRLGMDQCAALALGNISSIYKERGDIAAALSALSEALEIFRKLEEKRYEATTRVKLGLLHEIHEDWQKALEELTLAAEIAQQIGNLDTYSWAEHRIGEHYLRRGRPDQALGPLKRGLEVADELGMIKPAADIHQSLAEAYHASGNPAEAFEHLKECATLKERIFGEERQRAIAEMQTRFDVERVEREREILRLKNQHLEETMEQRSKELATLAMHLVQKNTFLEKLRKDTLRLAEKHPAARPDCDDLMRAIAANLNDDDDWQRFEREFQLVHNDFLQMLARTYPSLSPAEMKICALLKINLSNKEITRLLSVSLRNVESHRYAIRRKLGLATDVNLSAYLARM